MSFPNKAPNALDHVKLKVDVTVFYKMYILGNVDFVISYQYLIIQQRLLDSSIFVLDIVFHL